VATFDGRRPNLERRKIMSLSWLCRWLKDPFRAAGQMTRRPNCRPAVEALERREVPFAYPAWHGFTTTEGRTFYDLNCNWHYGGNYDLRPPSNYQVTIHWGDGTPDESGYVQFINDRPGNGYELFSHGHAYAHWTAPDWGIPSPHMVLTLTDLNPPPGTRDPSVTFDSDIAVFPALTGVRARPIIGGYAAGDTVNNVLVATVNLPNAAKISSPLAATVVWNDHDISSTNNGKARIVPLGGDEFAVYVSGHTFQPFWYHAPYANEVAGAGYGGPYGYGFSVFFSTQANGLNGGYDGSGSAGVTLDMTGTPDPLPTDTPPPQPSSPQPVVHHPRARHHAHRLHHRRVGTRHRPHRVDPGHEQGTWMGSPTADPGRGDVVWIPAR
jgi:hypothetical protein